VLNFEFLIFIVELDHAFIMNNSTFIISIKAQNIGTIAQRRYGVVNEDTKVLKRFFSPDINYCSQNPHQKWQRNDTPSEDISRSRHLYAA
jgi:hypothetical protein